MNVYVDFGGVSVKRGWKNASGPLPDHLAPQPDRNLKFCLHSSLDLLNAFLTSTQSCILDEIFIPNSGTKNFVVDEKKMLPKQYPSTSTYIDTKANRPNHRQNLTWLMWVCVLIIDSVCKGGVGNLNNRPNHRRKIDKKIVLVLIYIHIRDSCVMAGGQKPE